MIVYAHRNPKTNDIFYIGIGAKQERAKRFKSSQRNQYWHNYVKKYGQPIVEILHTVETRKEAVELEMQLIKKYGRRIDGSGRLVNITIGGDGGALGVKQSEETKAKRTAKLKGGTHTEQSKNNMKKAQNRPEVKAKHVAFHNDQTWLQKQRDAKLGRNLTDEHKAKISKGLNGRVVSAETKAKISSSNSGKKRTIEQRERLSMATFGRKRKPESILKSAIANCKPVLNTATGIYYDSLKDAAASIPMNLNTFRSKMAGYIKNNTNFIYA